MNNDFIDGFEKIAGMTSMGKITKIIKRVKIKKPTEFPKATPHPVDVKMSNQIKGKEQLWDAMRNKIGNKKMEEVVRMSRAKKIAKYNQKTPVPAKKPEVTHDYNQYRKEFKDKARSLRSRSL